MFIIKLVIGGIIGFLSGFFLAKWDDQDNHPVRCMGHGMDEE